MEEGAGVGAERLEVAREEEAEAEPRWHRQHLLGAGALSFVEESSACA
jgi:hypothetical protein